MKLNFETEKGVGCIKGTVQDRGHGLPSPFQSLFYGHELTGELIINCWKGDRND